MYRLLLGVRANGTTQKSTYGEIFRFDGYRDETGQGAQHRVGPDSDGSDGEPVLLSSTVFFGDAGCRGHTYTTPRTFFLSMKKGMLSARATGGPSMKPRASNPPIESIFMPLQEYKRRTRLIVTAKASYRNHVFLCTARHARDYKGVLLSRKSRSVRKGGSFLPAGLGSPVRGDHASHNMYCSIVGLIDWWGALRLGVRAVLSGARPDVCKSSQNVA